MAGFVTKVYIVQKYERGGVPGEVIAAKLTYGSAHEVAKKHAPARVIFAIADKTLHVNVPARR